MSLTSYFQKTKTENKSRKRKTRNVIYDESEYVKLPVNGIVVKLPPGIKPYISQRLMMIRIIQCLKTSTNVLIESPTGSGKTLALLSGACSWMADYKEQQRIKRLECPVHGLKRNNKVTEESPEHENLDSSAITFVDDTEDFIQESSLNVKPPLIENEENPCNCLPSVRIYYGTRTHKQISQVVKEFSRLPYSQNRTIRHSILASREQSCLNQEVKNSGDMNQACRELLSPEGRGCLYKHNLRKTDNNPGRLRMIIDRNDGGIWDIEDLTEALKSPQICPYFTTTHILPVASDIIFTPFNYLLDPIIRVATNVNLKNAVVILDEAHNVEDTCRDSASFQFKESEFINGIASFNERIQQLTQTLSTFASDNNIEDLLPSLKEYLEVLKKMSLLAKTMHSLFQKVCKIALTRSNDRNQFGRASDKATYTFSWMDTKRFLRETELGQSSLLFEDNTILDEYITDFRTMVEQKKSNPEISEHLRLFSISNVGIVLVEKYLYFMDYYLRNNNQEYYRMNISFEQIIPSSTQSNFRKKKKEAILNEALPGFEAVMNLWCMFPSVACADTFKDCRTVILASGTLCPTETLKTELGLSFAADVEGKQVIPNDQIFTSIVPKGRSGKTLTCTYSAIDDDFYNDLTMLICDVCSVVPKGVLVFVSSYRILEKIRDFLTKPIMKREIEKYKKIFYEPNRSKDLEEILDEYTAAIRNPTVGTLNGALMIAVYRGKVSEGIDFADDMARCVMCVGIPYPNAMDELVKQKKLYNDQNQYQQRILNGDEWYSTQAYRALNQALGRCLRHINDWGAILLVDERYRQKTKPSNPDYKKISTWVREQVTCFKSYGEFMNNLQSFVNKRVKIDAENQLKIGNNTAEISVVKENIKKTTSEKYNASAAVFGI